MKRLVILFILIIAVGGCRGQRSRKEPIHLNPNMDVNPKVKAQRGAALPPENTVAFATGNPFSENNRSSDLLAEDTEYYQGKTKDGQIIAKIPVEVNQLLINRGEERYNIYCSVCHDKTGSGKGIVIKRGFVPPPKFSDKRILDLSDGQIFDLITNGVRNMPAYDKQVPVADRWAIVAYLRVLQKMDTATKQELSADVLKKLKG